MEADGVCRRVDGDPMDSYVLREPVAPPDEQLHLLAPTSPRSIFGLSENFGPLPSRLSVTDQVFTKAINTLNASGARIRIPPDSTDIFFEGELVVIIGRLAKGVPEDLAEGHIFGYACGNDISENGWFAHDKQWWRVKGADGFSPVGPWAVPRFNWREARLRTLVNGVVRQEAQLSDMRTTPAQAVATISRYVTLVPGDLIFLGTPSGAGTLRPGDSVVVDITGLGTLRNTLEP